MKKLLGLLNVGIISIGLVGCGPKQKEFHGSSVSVQQYSQLRKLDTAVAKIESNKEHLSNTDINKLQVEANKGATNNSAVKSSIKELKDLNSADETTSTAAHDMIIQAINGDTTTVTVNRVQKILGSKTSNKKVNKITEAILE